jgi:periplasmic divalent cation tolerance protein
MMELHATCKDKKEAEKISKILLKKKLAACINYFPITSTYIWNKKIESASEYLLIIKTSDKKEKQAIEAIKKNHSYKLPVIISYKIKTTKEAEKWIEDSTT